MTPTDTLELRTKKAAEKEGTTVMHHVRETHPDSIQTRRQEAAAVMAHDLKIQK